ncbi:hypothetical protein [Sphingomonas sp. TDK1]|uniref:hypothetical protein n=1 Tax=Sphingomonas sp. TDK1 TaxID=453247 RepID=UPI0007DA2A1F|nr:hypothetical protein [Sphingomonas sp. TDK1]OAN58473.1 hypothetical protein A7X12_05345 [Sphingomonas sp. TDK1]
MAYLKSQLPLAAEESGPAASAPQNDIVAVAHEARQKMCANVLNVHLIADQLAKAGADSAAVAPLLDRIVEASRFADASLETIQQMILEA